MATTFPTTVDTATQLFTQVNGVNTTLSDNPLLIGATTVNVASTTNFPSVGYIVIETEIISYTGKTATSFTGCTRAADGSTAAQHATGLTVNAYIVADHHNALMGAIIAIETLLGGATAHLDLTGRPGYGIKMKSPNGNITVIVGVDNDGNFGIIG